MKGIQKKESDRKSSLWQVSRDVYIPPTQSGKYNILQYIIEAEYVFPAGIIILGTLFIWFRTIFSHLSLEQESTHFSLPLVDLLMMILLPTYLAWFSHMAYKIARFNEWESTQHK